MANAEEQRATLGGQEVAAYPHGGTVSEFSVSPDGKFFATSGSDRHVTLWHTPTSLRVLRFGGGGGLDVLCHAWSPDSSKLAIGISLGPSWCGI